jgi:tetratricopeptide (TPR) repeat protein
VKASARFPENMAWCLVELGHMYFKTGHWNEAEAAYQKAIETFPSTHAAHAGLASVKAAKGEIQAAIEAYKKAQSITPMVQYAAALYDLYELAGDKNQTRMQADTIDMVAKLERAANQKANRTLALVYANQDRNLPYALELAQADFEIRKDVYTFDALAWALYKNGRLEEANKMSSEALKTGAPEAVFHYHAGVIAHALGDEARSTEELKKALQLNPAFDVRQTAIARSLLEHHQALNASQPVQN